MNSNNIKLKLEANNYPSWQLTNRQICDLELILNGGFDPLNEFLSKHDYDFLMRLYKPHMEKLYKMFGKRIKEWDTMTYDKMIESQDD